MHEETMILLNLKVVHTVISFKFLISCTLDWKECTNKYFWSQFMQSHYQ